MFEDNVTITGECFNLFEKVLLDFENRVYNIMEHCGYTYTITSANDGKHSKNSTHYQNKALDVRINNIDLSRQYMQKYLEGIVMFLGDNYSEFVFILHLYDGKNHLHMQHGVDNIISFDGAIGENVNVFIK